MSALLIAVTMGVSPPAAQSFASQEAVAASLAEEAQTGTLIFSQGDCLAVRVFTNSPYTHVAAVLVRQGDTFVYDSSSGVGVRCQTLENYLASQSPDEVHLFHPVTSFSARQTRAFQNHLDGELGRPYAIKHHLTGERADGVHCAEYVTDALMACRIIHAKQPPRVSPASLAEGIVKADLYTAGKTISFKSRPAFPPKKSNWCARMWFQTKQCTANCCAKMQRWFLCR